MKSLIPGLGDRTTRKKLRELEKKAGTLPVVFALLFTEGIKIIVSGIPVPFFPEAAWFHFIGESLKFIITALAVGAAYVYEDERRQYTEKAKEKASDAKDKAGEAKDKAKEKASEAKDKAKDKTEDE